MRTLTIKSGNGNSSYEEGWHELLISKAEYKEWNGTKCISSSLEGADGTKIVKLDDSAEALMGKRVNVYLYKDGKYSKPLGKVAPVEFQNAVETFTSADVIYWKGKAVDFYKKYVEPKVNQRLEAAITNPAPVQPEPEAEMPF